MNKKGAVAEGYPSTIFEKREIDNLSDVAKSLPRGGYKVRCPVYRTSDDRIMAAKDVVLKEARAEIMKREISEALRKNKSSPYYTEIVTKGR